MLAFRLSKLHTPANQKFLTPMKPPKTDRPSKEQPAFLARGQAAAKTMAKELRAEHKRWNLPLLSWKDGKIIASKP